MPSISRGDIRPGSELHKLVKDEVQHRVKLAQRDYHDMLEVYEKAEDAMLAYLPERETDRKRRWVREQAGLPQYTTLVVPYTYAVTMASHTYWTSVFLGRDPIYQFTARHGETQQQVLAVEALMDYQRQVGIHNPYHYSWLYDVGRYGAGIVGTWWDNEIKRITTIQEEPQLDELGVPLLDEDGQPEVRKAQVTTEGPGYQGNRLYNIQPRDFLSDPRVTLRDFQKGEFCIVRRRISWMDIKRLERAGMYVNVDRIDHGIPTRFPDERGNDNSQLRRPEQANIQQSGLDSQSSLDKKHPDLVPVYECHIQLIPKEWKLSKSDYPERWVMTVTCDWKTVIGVTPLGAWHDRFPFQVMEMEPDAYQVVNRGMPEILDPVQRTMDWLVNSHLYNVRAALNNLFIADPSMVVMKDIEDPLPGGVIRLKPSAYGQDVRTALHQVPIGDVTQGHFRDMDMMQGIGERTVGVNDQILGALQQGGRKTATEVRTSSTFGVNRLKAIAEYMSAVGFEPLASMMLSNSQQYYSGEKKYKIVGNLATHAGPAFLNVDRESIMGDYDFVAVDGTMPVDRLAQANLFKDILAQVVRIPGFAEQFDVFKMFAHIGHLTGIRNMDQFRVQVMPDEQVAQQAQQGNVVPLSGDPNQPTPISGGIGATPLG